MSAVPRPVEPSCILPVVHLCLVTTARLFTLLSIMCHDVCESPQRTGAGVVLLCSAAAAAAAAQARGNLQGCDTTRRKWTQKLTSKKKLPSTIPRLMVWTVVLFKFFVFSRFLSCTLCLTFVFGPFKALQKREKKTPQIMDGVHFDKGPILFQFSAG